MLDDTASALSERVEVLCDVEFAKNALRPARMKRLLVIMRAEEMIAAKDAPCDHRCKGCRFEFRCANSVGGRLWPRAAEVGT